MKLIDIAHSFHIDLPLTLRHLLWFAYGSYVTYRAVRE